MEKRGCVFQEVDTFQWAEKARPHQTAFPPPVPIPSPALVSMRRWSLALINVHHVPSDCVTPQTFQWAKYSLALINAGWFGHPAERNRFQPRSKALIRSCAPSLLVGTTSFNGPGKLALIKKPYGVVQLKRPNRFNGPMESRPSSI